MRPLDTENIMGNKPRTMDLPLKPHSCPACGHAPVASILYGTLRLNEGLQRKIREGRVTVGGRYIREDDPWWECTGCGLKFRRRPD